MAQSDLVRTTRDGDQFHYLWAARQCLGLLPGMTDLVAVTIEGASTKEAAADSISEGDELIDVGLYFGAEGLGDARLIRYVQLKHSTLRNLEPWTASGLEKTVKGFAKRYAKLIARFPVEDIGRRVRFEFTTTRPIDPKVIETVSGLAAGTTAPQHPELHRTLIEYAGLDQSTASQFFSLFSLDGGEEDLWAQRSLLTQDIRGYLPDADYDAPVQLKELVTRKATTEFASNPSIRRHDVLRALKSSEEQLQPAKRLIPDAFGTLPREKEREILSSVLAAQSPVVIHADAGVGKSILAARLAASMPEGSQAILYDCFGDGLYRSSLHFRHRHRDALVQIANELASRGLCHPLIPTIHADAKLYMRAFLYRLAQAAQILQARDPSARLCLIIDAADNAEMAAEEQREPASFVRDLIRAPLPTGVRIAFTCRTHRRSRLGAPLNAQDVPLEPFSEAESAQHLRKFYPTAIDADVAEFAFLSSSNPRLQALALSSGLSLPEMLKQLGPAPTTVEHAIRELLESAVARLKDQAGITESAQIDVICQALAVLRPLVPIRVLALLSQTPESAIRSFALDFGRPLLLKGDSLHFLDEPAETWFRERFTPDPSELVGFIGRLRPLAAESSYVAAALPQIMLQAGLLDELVELALSGQSLPVENPLARRDVELQRLTFALKACLQQGRYLAAAKLALKAGGESAGEHRQNNLIQHNTDLAGSLVDPDRVEDIVSRRTFSSGWMGSHHVYDAGLLSGRDEFSAEASSRLRMALDWLRAWARLPDETRNKEKVSDEDRVEIALTLLRLRGPEAAADFLRSWTWRRIAFKAGQQLASRIIELGRYDQLDALAGAAGNDVWLLLGIAAAARLVAHPLPTAPLARLLRLLGDRRVKLPEGDAWREDFELLYAITSAIELALQVLPRQPEVWATILRRYLPSSPPSNLASRFGFVRAPLLRAYALEAALRGTQVTLLDLAPADVRDQIEAKTQYGRKQETDVFMEEVGGLLPWVVLSADIQCGRPVGDFTGTIDAALKTTSSAESRSHRRDHGLRQAVALEWLRILCSADFKAGREFEAFKSWLASHTDPLWPKTLTDLCRSASHTAGLERLALDLAAKTFEVLEKSREDAESRIDSYVALARAIYVISPAEARVYFDRAVEIASRIGDENLSRWTAFLYLASASAAQDDPKPRTAYRLSRAAELTYEYVARDKHFEWEGTVEALTDLCASSAFAILARWRDRRFGDQERLLPTVVYRLMERGRLPATTPVALAGVEAAWKRRADLERIVADETDPILRSVAARVAYRYMRVQPPTGDELERIKTVGTTFNLDFPDIDRLIRLNSKRGSTSKDSPSAGLPSSSRERRRPDWDSIFKEVDLRDADKLRASHAALRTFDPPYEFDTFFKEAFARVKAGFEPELIRAIGSWPDFGIFDLRYLLDAVSAELRKQPSVRNAVRDAVLSACRREPERVQRRGWGALIPFAQLDSDGVVSDADVVRATLEGFTAQVDQLDSSELFRLVQILAACLSPNEANEGLNFGLDLLEGILRPEDGDGPWRSELQPPESIMTALGGYVWAGLGSPVVAERWQYAHVARSAVELGWTELVRELIACADNNTESPFVDRGLAFYVWHARQWLLIGFARGGVENPKSLTPAVALLQRFVGEEHVIIRAFAAETLRTLVTNGESTIADLSQLDAVNRSELPDEVYAGWSEPHRDDTFESGNIETDEEKYYFGIDITPYWFGPLGKTFGLSEKSIERRVKHALRKNMGWKGGGWKSDARHTRRIFNEGETYHSHGSMPKTDDLTDYHGYHGMMFVAAALLKERPVLRSAEESDSRFHQWLSEHLLTAPDCRWLFDRRDPRLVVHPPPPKSYDDKAWRWSVTAGYLDQQLFWDDNEIVFWGDWTGGDSEHEDHEETISVRSALVSRDGAEALVASLQTAPELGRFGLPDAEDREGLEIGSLGLMGWVSDQNLSARLDEGDPWSKGLSYPGLAPFNDVIKKLGLIGSSDARRWTAGTDGLIRSETWTHLHGYGREEQTIAGSRLTGNLQFLRRLLDAYPDSCLLLSVSILRRRPREQRSDLESYRSPYIRYYLMGADGVAHSL